MDRIDFFAFNTHNAVAADAPDDALESIRAAAKHYETLFSRTDRRSELRRLNDSRDAATPVEAELAKLVEAALAYSRDTGGLFDITMGNVVKLWDFKNAVVPDAAAVEDARSCVGWKNIRVDGATVVRANPDAHIDLGGIAKGYIADRFKETLASKGARRMLIDLGGNIAVAGGKPDGSPWRIGIRTPAPSWSAGGADSFATIGIYDGSVVTSGVYERAFVRDGRLYHHILDPETGFPAETDLLSATVVSRDSIDGDGYATALILMGTDRAIAFAEAHPRIEAVLLTREGDVLATSGIGSDVEWQLNAPSA